MENSITYESFIDIIWPTIKRFTTDQSHSFIFDDLTNYFNENGFVMNYESKRMITDIFVKVSDVIRDYIFQKSKNNEALLKESCKFIQEAMVDVAKCYMITVPSEEEFMSDFKTYIQNWFVKTKNDNEQGRLLTFTNPEEYLSFLKYPNSKLETLKSLPQKDALCELIHRGCGSGDLTNYNFIYGPIGQYFIDKTIHLSQLDQGVTENTVTDLLEISLYLPYLHQLFEKIYKIRKQLDILERNLKLSKFKEKFMHDCKKLVSSLDKDDRYHGTTRSALESINQYGLFMVSENLDSTSYILRNLPSFNDKDEFLNSLLLSRSGFDGSRGEAMVFIKKGAKILSISEEEKKNMQVDYSMGGPLGINYKIEPRDIIGTINTITQTVTFGQAFQKSEEKEL